ncbi:MAG: hypothetical protein ACR2FJ_05060 [Qipengyuania sp.]
MRAIAASLAMLILTACAASGPPRPSERVERMVRNVAQPGTVVATDIAFARAAREDGQWTAFRRFAADGAIIHGRNGPIEAGPWLAAQKDLERALQWTPLAIWSSCDGQMAVSQGKFAEPQGQWGYYVTAWERQRDYSYRWTYYMGATDAALTERERERGVARRPDANNTIVVEAIAMIQGEVADCPADGVMPPLPPTSDRPSGARGGRTVSRDGTLLWEWEHHPDGKRFFLVRHWRGGEWLEALRFEADAEGKYVPS